MYKAVPKAKVTLSGDLLGASCADSQEDVIQMSLTVVNYHWSVSEPFGQPEVFYDVLMTQSLLGHSSAQLCEPSANRRPIPTFYDLSMTWQMHGHCSGRALQSSMLLIPGRCFAVVGNHNLTQVVSLTMTRQ